MAATAWLLAPLAVVVYGGVLYGSGGILPEQLAMLKSMLKRRRT
jgi:hypothetical protein